MVACCWLADDGGTGYTDAMNVSTRAAVTPHLTALAERGTTFTHAYTVVSSCSPSRAAILTGLPPHQNGQNALHDAVWGATTTTPGIDSIVSYLNRRGFKTGVIGKYHVAPIDSFNFTYGMGKTGADCWSGQYGTDEFDCSSQLPLPPDAGGAGLRGAPDGFSGYNLVARNITFMKLAARQFITELEAARPWMLWVGFGDCHRAGYHSPSGSFAEYFGSGVVHMGVQMQKVPDYNPRFFANAEVAVPPWLPDHPSVREDIAAAWSALHRLDQGIGLIAAEAESGLSPGDSLIAIYFAGDKRRRVKIFRLAKKRTGATRQRYPIPPGQDQPVRVGAARAADCGAEWRCEGDAVAGQHGNRLQPRPCADDAGLCGSGLAVAPHCPEPPRHLPCADDCAAKREGTERGRVSAARPVAAATARPEPQPGSQPRSSAALRSAHRQEHSLWLARLPLRGNVLPDALDARRAVPAHPQPDPPQPASDPVGFPRH